MDLRLLLLVLMQWFCVGRCGVVFLVAKLNRVVFDCGSVVFSGCFDLVYPVGGLICLYLAGVGLVKFSIIARPVRRKLHLLEKTSPVWRKLLF